MVDAVAVFQAFAAGVLSFFAPCSVAMLPAYVSYYLGRDLRTGPVGGRALPGSEPVRWLIAGEAVLAATALAFYQDSALAEPLLIVGSPVVGMAGLLALTHRAWEPRDLQAIGVATAGLAGATLVLLGLVDVTRVSSGVSRLGFQQFGLTLAGTVLLLAAGLRATPGPAARGARVGAIVSLGILGVFGLLGLPFFGLLRVLDFAAQTALVLLVALAMIAFGALGLAGRDVGFALPIKAPKDRDDASFAIFGVGYGLVALGCNLPLFLLAALGPLVRDADAPTALLALLAYGAGMALLMVALSVGLAMGRGLTEQRLRAAIPRVKTLGNVVLVLAGLYIVYYDVTVLGLGS